MTSKEKIQNILHRHRGFYENKPASVRKRYTKEQFEALRKAAYDEWHPVLAQPVQPPQPSPPQPVTPAKNVHELPLKP